MFCLRLLCGVVRICETRYFMKERGLFLSQFYKFKRLALTILSFWQDLCAIFCHGRCVEEEMVLWRIGAHA
jgi:hypothetical protein